MDLLAWPVRFVGGRALVVDRDTDAGVSQRIALLCKTRRGERPLVPAFGIPDPAFRDGIDVVEINAGLALFGPDVTVDVVGVEQTGPAAARVELAWASADTLAAS